MFKIPESSEFDPKQGPRRINDAYLGTAVFDGASREQTDAGNQYLAFDFTLLDEPHNGLTYQYRLWRPREATQEEDVTKFMRRLAHLLRVFVPDNPVMTKDENKVMTQEVLREVVHAESWSELCEQVVEFVEPHVGKSDMIVKIAVGLRQDGTVGWPNFTAYLPFICDSRDRFAGELRWSNNELTQIQSYRAAREANRAVQRTVEIESTTPVGADLDVDTEIEL